MDRMEIDPLKDYISKIFPPVVLQLNPAPSLYDRQFFAGLELTQKLKSCSIFLTQNDHSVLFAFLFRV